jgi:hypothetical protein
MKSQERKGALGIKLEKGAAHFVALCKLHYAQILADLGVEIERLESEIFKSKVKELEGLTIQMVRLVHEVSPSTLMFEKKRYEKLRREEVKL